MDKLTEGAVSVMLAIVGVAILAVLVSQRSQTAGVLQALGQSFSSMLGAATGPVTGTSSSLTMPSLGNLSSSIPNYGLGSGF